MDISIAKYKGKCTNKCVHTIMLVLIKTNINKWEQMSILLYVYTICIIIDSNIKLTILKFHSTFLECLCL